MQKKVWLHLPDNTVTFDSKDILIGPWIFQGKESEYPNFRNLNFLNISHESFCRSLISRELNEYSRIFVNKNLNFFNSKNKINFSESFWFHMLGGWLNLLFQISYLRYFYIKKLVETYQDEKVIVEVSPDFSWKFKTTHDFATTTSFEGFDYWLSSYFVKKLKPKSWTIIEKKIYEAKVEKPSEHVKSNLRDFWSIKNGIRKIILSFIEKEDRFSVLGSSWKSQLFMNIFLKYLYRTNKNKKKFEVKENVNLLQKERDFLDELAFFLIPSFFINGSIKKISRNYNDRFIVKTLTISGSDIYNEEKKLKNAYFIEKGGVLATCQHGSFYGVVQALSASHCVEYESDYFFTWGWSQYNGFDPETFIPLPAPTLSLKRKSNNIEKKQILFLDKMYNLKSSRLSGQPLPEELLESLDEVEKFIKILLPDVKENLVLRPHVYHHNQTLKSEVYNHYPVFEEKEYSNFVNKLFSVKLLICNHYGTTIHQALSWNIPFVCYFDDQITEISKESKDIFNKLKNANIVHNDFEGAAKHINIIVNDIDKWWLSESVQNIRKEFCNKYARSSKYWLLHWLKFLIFSKGKQIEKRVFQR